VWWCELSELFVEKMRKSGRKAICFRATLGIKSQEKQGLTPQGRNSSAHRAQAGSGDRGKQWRENNNNNGGRGDLTEGGRPRTKRRRLGKHWGVSSENKAGVKLLQEERKRGPCNYIWGKEKQAKQPASVSRRPKVQQTVQSPRLWERGKVMKGKTAGEKGRFVTALREKAKANAGMPVKGKGTSENSSRRRIKTWIQFR